MHFITRHLNEFDLQFLREKSWQLFFLILAVNLLQSIFTPLVNDEAYYWLYSQYPAWGYLDHPPMVSVLIKLGSVLLNHEVGVRLFNSLLGSFTFFFIYKIIEKEATGATNYRLVFLLLFSSLFLNLYSFLAIPDTAMLFSGTLFLYTYRSYINRESIANTLLLALVAAFLLYSKYHGILLIGFTVLSNPKLLLKRSFYLVFIGTLILLAPHIYWQAAHDYPTIRFQLFSRVGEFNIAHVFSYIGEQAAVTGPVVLLLFSILYKPANTFQRALKFNVAGVFLFFFLSSFKEMVNVHWTAIAFPPMICLAYLYLSASQKKHILCQYILVLNLVIVITMRLNFMFNWFQISHFNDRNPIVMAAMLREKTNGAPLVFEDVYNEPSYQTFYQHQPAFAVNNLWYKQTQYNRLNVLEDDFIGKDVIVVSSGLHDSTSIAVKIPKGKQYFLTKVMGFSSFAAAISIKIAVLTELKSSQKSTIAFMITNRLTEKEKNFLSTHPQQLLFTMTNASTRENQTFKYDNPVDFITGRPLMLRFKAPDKKGKYLCVFSVKDQKSFFMPFNSNVYTINVR